MTKCRVECEELEYDHNNIQQCSFDPDSYDEEEVEGLLHGDALVADFDKFCEENK